MKKEYVWLFMETGELVISTRKCWGDKPFSLYKEKYFWDGPAVICKYQFLFLGEL